MRGGRGEAGYLCRDLANKVITSVFQLEATSRVEKLAAVDRLQEAPDLGPSYLGNIQEQVQQLSGAKFVAVRVGDAAPAIWWNTRLHLVAALASDFTQIAQLVLAGKNDLLLAMAEPTEVRRALARSDPRLELTRASDGVREREGRLQSMVGPDQKCASPGAR